MGTIVPYCTIIALILASQVSGFVAIAALHHSTPASSRVHPRYQLEPRTMNVNGFKSLSKFDTYEHSNRILECL